MNKIKELTKSSFEITYELFIVMIPTLIVVKILDEIGFVEIWSVTGAPFACFITSSASARGFFDVK